MAPSRGVSTLRPIICTIKYCASRRQSTFARLVIDSSRKTQIYISRTLDPYINLSIEHFLLQKSPPDSTILFLYTNRPCIVIGRNQNPWVEVNLGLLNAYGGVLENVHVDNVSLVRRRSGGGTVFHDEGNVNYSVVCPTAAFDRDKHAQMVVRALHRLGATRAKVNERHDIVLDYNGEDGIDPIDRQISGIAGTARADRRPLKISGSAYKLTRLRSLHHGTCLLSSPNIDHISKYLRSPAKPYIKARGVKSVSSPITNVNVPNVTFEKAVIEEFNIMYDAQEPITLTDEVLEVPEIASGLAEIRSLEWIYMQTPQFTFSSHETEDDPLKSPSLTEHMPPGVVMSFTARSGTITQAEVAISDIDSVSNGGEAIKLDTSSMLETKIHTIKDWQAMIPGPLNESRNGVSRWLNKIFGISL